MLTISDFYAKDVSEETVFVLEYPTSCTQLRKNERFLRNTTQWLVDDEFKVPSYESYRIEMPLRAMSAFGDKAKVFAEVRPDPRLEEHWDKMMGSRGKLRYADLGQDGVPHVVLFPMEVLPPELHAVDPDAHYHVHSKAFIPTVACPQPEVLHSLRLPAVLKACRAAGAEGTWFIRSKEDFVARKAWIKQHMPRADVILTEFIQNTVCERSCQVYINKLGEVSWIGVTGKVFDESGFWCGSSVDRSSQERGKKKYYDTLEPIFKGLHANNYFGWCGIDVLEDKGGRQYVIDINPRLCGSSGFLLISMHLEKTKGWQRALLKTGISINKSLLGVIDAAEKMVGGDVIVLSAYTKDDKTISTVAFFADTSDRCINLANRFVAINRN